MFVERMEELEYRQKFDVELSTFPDSTNTETPKKMVFSLTYVCVRKSLSVDILRTSWPLWMKISVYVAIGLESRTSPSQYNRTNISPQFGEGGDFCNFLNPYISKTIVDIEKQRRPYRCKI